jgi:hypothetical protein
MDDERRPARGADLRVGLETQQAVGSNGHRLLLT